MDNYCIIVIDGTKVLKIQWFLKFIPKNWFIDIFIPKMSMIFVLILFFTPFYGFSVRISLILYEGQERSNWRFLPISGLF